MVVLDVVEEILLRLLVKDLLRCKSVCKSWYSLISSPSFVKTHRKFMCNKKDINTRRIAMLTPEWNVQQYSYERWYESWSMEGSSNGLVCLYTEDANRIIVTNPLTRDFVELANPPKHPRCDWCERCLGFGYDSSTDDYKVVTVICTGYGGALVHIFSLKSNIWIFFGQINYRVDDRWFDIIGSPLAKPGILFNGALHWFWLDAKDTSDDIKILIVSFDLAKEEFREIPQPDDTRYVWNDNSSLGIIEGSLCIFIKEIHPVNNPRCRIWVMKNYNGKPSWELLQITNHCEMKELAIHYMQDSNNYRIPTYFCDDNIRLSRSEEYISSPIFVQTLVWPYVKEKRETEEEEEDEEDEW